MKSILNNPFNDYMLETGMLNGEMAKLLGVCYSSVHRYRHSDAVPGLDIARKIYHVTGGKVSMAFWGYTIKNGKFIKSPKTYKHRLKQAKYSPFTED